MTALPVLPPSRLPTPLAGDGPLADAQGRRMTYLRLSVTDRCHYRCTYCSPSDWAGRAHLLTTDELVRLVRVFAGLGIRRVRLTGGEPLLRDDLVTVARAVSALDGIDTVCLTTNGHRLADLAAPLRDAGVSQVNVSLDTTDPARFRTVTGNGDVRRVLAGLEAASRVGFTRLGVNIVVMAGVNDDGPALAGLARLAWSLGAVPRFIERMPFAGDAPVVSGAETRARLALQGLVCEAPREVTGAGPARYHVVREGGRVVGEAGFIGAMTENFCDRCNRVRVTATGELRACLGGREQVPLAPALRAGADDAALAALVRGALAAKWDGHRFHEAGGRLLPMMAVGG